MREYLVIDAVLREVHVHLEPMPQGYASRRTFAAYAPRLADLPTA